MEIAQLMELDYSPGSAVSANEVEDNTTTHIQLVIG